MADLLPSVAHLPLPYVMAYDMFPIKTLDEKKARQSKDESSESTLSLSDELQEVVFVIDKDGKVSRREVSTGIQDMNHFEIISGLKEGEKIVSGPYSAVSRSLRSGNRVKVVSKEELFEK